VIIAAFIEQIRANAPIFGGRVAGAAEFVAGLKNYNTSMALPAAYVLPLGQEADPNEGWGNLQQIVHKTIGIAVEFDAQQDRRGQAPVMAFDLVETQLYRSVLNLRIGDCRMARGTYFSGARYLDLDRARLFYQWEFAVDWQISELDGVQPTDDAILLEALDLDIHKAPLEEHPESAALVRIITGPNPPTEPPT